MSERSTEDAILFAENTVKSYLSKGPTGRKGSAIAVVLICRKRLIWSHFHVLWKSCILNTVSLGSYLDGCARTFPTESTPSKYMDSSPHIVLDDVKAGVVQGSVVGPLLFSAYINSVANSDAEGTMKVLFADDLLLMVPFSNEQERDTVQAFYKQYP